MHIPTHEEVLGTIDAFLDRHPAIGPARFGRDATGEPGLLGRLRKGSTPTLKVLNRIKAYMDAKDAEVRAARGDHAAADTSQVQHASCGSETNLSAANSRFAVGVNYDAAAAEGEGVGSALPGGLAA